MAKKKNMPAPAVPPAPKYSPDDLLARILQQGRSEVAVQRNAFDEVAQRAVALREKVAVTDKENYEIGERIEGIHRKMRDARAEVLLHVLRSNPALIDVLAPEHRTVNGCSDARTSITSTFACARCFLLEALKYGYVDTSEYEWLLDIRYVGKE